jgi:hypothetical protein
LITNDLATQTVFYRVRAGLSARPLGRGEVVSVIIRNPFTNANNTPNVLEVLVGDGATQAYDLLPGANTPEIFTADLKDIYVRVRVAVDLVNETDLVVIAHEYAEPVRNVSKRRL